MTHPDATVSRSIIEALRTGVPSPLTVRHLASQQVDIDQRFKSMLRGVASATPSEPRSLMLGGNFGDGKSHTLEALAHDALEEGFIVSRATVSKSLQLGREMELLYQLLQETKAPGYEHDAFAQRLAVAHDQMSTEGMLGWVRPLVYKDEVAQVFEASLEAFPNLVPGQDSFATVIDYWAGSSELTNRVRSAIRQGAPHWRGTTPKFPLAADRGKQTVRFLARLFQELGYRGWIVLFDEVEQIKLLGPIARAKSYAQLAFWMGLTNSDRIPGLGAVGAVTSNFYEQHIDGSNIWGDRDEFRVPESLARNPSNHRFEKPARAAMSFIGASCVQMSKPSQARLVELQDTVRDHYQGAYGARVGSIPFKYFDGQSIRSYIRSWITEWDLTRQGRSGETDRYVVAPNEVADDEDAD